MLLPLLLLAGCGGDRSADAPEGRVPVLITPSASREGLPQPPRVVAGEREQRQARRAEAAYAERLGGVARALVPELRAAGAREVTLRRPPGGLTLMIRALVPPAALEPIEARPDVGRVARLVKRAGRVERRDLALILTTDEGRRYDLRGLVGARAREVEGARIEVEGEEWRGAVAPPPVPGVPTFIVLDWRRLD